MGILDALSGGDDPAQQQGMTALAMGLLGGGNFNEALSRGLGARQAAINDYTKQQLMKQQLSAAQLDMQMRQLQMQRMGDATKVLQGMIGRSNTAPQPGQAGSGTMGIDVPGGSAPTGGLFPADYLTVQQRAQQGDPQAIQFLQQVNAPKDQFQQAPSQTDPWAWLRNATPQELQMLKLGGMDMNDLYKLATEPKTATAGSYMSLPGQPLRYMPDPTKGTTVDARGNVVRMPGADAAAYSAASSDASGKAAGEFSTKTFDVPDGKGGKTMVFGPAAAQMLPGAPASVGGQVFNGVQISKSRLEQMHNQAMNGDADAAGALSSYYAGLANPGAQRGAPAATAATSPYRAGYTPPDAQLAADKEAATGAVKSYQAYKDELTKTLGNDNQTVARNSFIEPLLTSFQTGKLGQEGRLTLSNYVQNSSLFGDDLKKKIIGMIGAGDPTTGKFIEQQLSSAALTTMLQTLDGNGKPNQAIFKALAPAQESILSGNGTLKDVFAAQRYLRDLKATELKSMAAAEAQPGFDRGNWASKWADQLDGIITNTPFIPPSRVALVSPSDAKNLRAHATDPAAIAEFDSVYKTPGLAKYIINGGK